MGRGSAIINIVIIAGPLITGVLLVLFSILGATAPKLWLSIAIAACVSGFMLFAAAKISVFCQGHFFSFGSKTMTPKFRFYYRAGYVLMLWSILLMAGLLILGGAAAENGELTGSGACPVERFISVVHSSV